MANYTQKPGGNSVSTPISVANGGTGISSYTIGDLIYASGATTLAKLADVATGSVLISGGVGVAPSWSDSPTVTTLTASTSVLTPLLDRASAGTLSIGTTTATAITLAQTTTLSAGKSLVLAAGAGGLTCGSGTGASTMPTGNWGWTGSSGSTFTVSGTNANVSITTTSGGTATFGGGTQTIISNNGSNRIVVGANVSIAGVEFTGSSSATFNWSPSTQDFTTSTGIFTYAGASTKTFNVTTTSASINLTTTTSGSIIANAATSGDVSLRNNGSTRLAVASTYHLYTIGAGATPATFGFRWTGAAHTAMTASTEAPVVNYNLAQTVQFATGALTTQRTFLVQAPTYGFVGASTITDAATVAITGAPITGTNATITNAYALWVQAGTARFDGGVSSTTFDGATVTIGGTNSTTTTVGRSGQLTVLNGNVENVIYEAGSATGIDGTTAASTTLLTVPTGKKFLLDKVVVVLTSISGGGLTPTVKIKNNTTSLDLITGTGLLGLTIADYTFTLEPTTSGAISGCASGDVIQLEITSGAGYTTYVMSAYIYGSLI